MKLLVSLAVNKDTALDKAIKYLDGIADTFEITNIRIGKYSGSKAVLFKSFKTRFAVTVTIAGVYFAYTVADDVSRYSGTIAGIKKLLAKFGPVVQKEKAAQAAKFRDKLAKVFSKVRPILNAAGFGPYKKYGTFIVLSPKARLGYHWELTLLDDETPVLTSEVDGPSARRKSYKFKDSTGLKQLLVKLIPRIKTKLAKIS